uniref:D-aminoacyl-tRNA deacylase n=1 Tax=Flavobacterium sp. TaxID=239 RepID=UPI0040499D02
MRLVIQRVSEARVEVNQTIVGQIKQGLLILVGIEHEDNQEDIDWLVKKIIGLRIFNDSEQQMNLSVQDIAGEIIVVSQFTLHASTKKGNRPSFINAAKPTSAKAIYEDFVKTLEYSFQKPIQTGIFGADMQLFLCNDGPVTIFIDSKNKS